MSPLDYPCIAFPSRSLSQHALNLHTITHERATETECIKLRKYKVKKKNIFHDSFGNVPLSKVT